MAVELSSAPLLSTCTQHLRPFQSRTNIHFHFPSLPIPLSLTTFPFSSSTATTRGKVLCQTAGAHFFDAQNAVEAGQNRLLKVPISHIRNFSIIAHIDHGKSTLADKLLQMTGTVQTREMKDQFLDNMDLERERGITIKLQAARMRYMYKNEAYCLNLIDTPGHVDFSYEVSRSLAACEGALLVVDASQGVEAQTLANVYLALDNNLEIIPVLNKIDLPGADPLRVIKEIEEIVGLDCSNAIQCSAKEGIGIIEILNAIVERVPPPRNTADRPLRALIFDSYYDPYRGVIVYFRVLDGRIKRGDRIYFMASDKDYFADEVGVLSPNQLEVEELYAGEVGYLSASIRSVADARVGDTITHHGRKAEDSLPGYEEATPMVFCGLFPVDADQFPELRDALEKLQLNDAALKFEPETSSAMGFGFRCGFLGLLHMEIVQMVGDFFDQLKSRSKGYASMEYSFTGYRESELIKLDIQINGDRVEPLSTIVHNNKAYSVGRALTQKLKELIPRQMFKVPIQACIGSKIIASETISAIRKDVLAKCYGGDITRKKKLLRKQAEGKKRMKAIGRVDVPQEAFMAVLKLEKEVL
ncbi:translation factor GUF1 homolog, chloroplastic isoform X4 [Cucumis sativus]|uniref:translation factor GUF1 homolog, chloroplastic isoform X4 n=1 Tax=Cucumis sativus TaxID=3659 RepID=UPI0012F51C4F|nr:translation factor GUF1 homolog, chloroplastic isoform X4 [Cucumis sativus]